MDNFIYERTGEDSWAEISPSWMRGDGSVVAGILGITGIDKSELYFFGYEGKIYSRIEGTWAQIDSPTHLGLRAATYADDRFVIVGQMGTIIEGRGNDWRIIEQYETENDFIGAATYNGTVYLATADEVYAMTGNELELILDADFENVMSTGMLYTGPSGLWSLGAEDLLLYDGDEWKIVGQTW